MALKITLDPGHGINYNRGIVKGFYESNSNFKMANYLKEELEKYNDVEVILTKTSQSQDPSTTQRGKMAATNGSRLFISLHSDAFSNSGAHGVSVFYSMKRPNSKDLGTKLGNAIVDVMKASTGITYLRRVEIKPGQKSPSTDYFGVIRNSVTGANVQESYLIEHGFHTNLKECTFLNYDENLKKIAKAEAEVIGEYYNLSKKGESTPIPDPTPIQGTVEVGDTVRVNRGAKTYTGGNIASFVYNNNYIVSSLKGDRAVLDKNGINSPFNVKDLTIVKKGNETSPAPQPSKIIVGSKVKVMKGAKSYEGKNIASFVYNNVYEVDELKGDRVVLDKGGITTAFNTNDLILVSGGGSVTPPKEEEKPETPAIPSTGFKKGDKVKVKSGAKSYEGKKIASFVYNGTYTIDEINGSRAVLDKKGICTAFNTKDLILVTSSSNTPSTPVDNTIKVGSRVKVKKGAKSYEGKGIASFVYNNVYTVDELKGKRAVLDKDGLCTAFNIDDLIKQ